MPLHACICGMAGPAKVPLHAWRGKLGAAARMHRLAWLNALALCVTVWVPECCGYLGAAQGSVLWLCSMARVHQSCGDSGALALCHGSSGASSGIPGETDSPGMAANAWEGACVPLMQPKEICSWCSIDAAKGDMVAMQAELVLVGQASGGQHVRHGRAPVLHG